MSDGSIEQDLSNDVGKMSSGDDLFGIFAVSFSTTVVVTRNYNSAKTRQRLAREFMHQEETWAYLRARGAASSPGPNRPVFSHTC